MGHMRIIYQYNKNMNEGLEGNLKPTEGENIGEGAEELVEKPKSEREKKKEIERLTFLDLRERLKDLIRGNPKKINDGNIKFANDLKKKYEKFNECCLFNVLYSRDYRDNYTFFDFPGEDSVEKFIQSLEEERAEGEEKEAEN